MRLFPLRRDAGDYFLVTRQKPVVFSVETNTAQRFKAANSFLEIGILKRYERKKTEENRRPYGCNPIFRTKLSNRGSLRISSYIGSTLICTIAFERSA